MTFAVRARQVAAWLGVGPTTPWRWGRPITATGDGLDRCKAIQRQGSYRLTD